MSHSADTRERRQHKRFPARGDAYAVLNNAMPSLGQIIDISQGGLSFRYVNEDIVLAGHADLDIFLLNRPMVMKRVPVQARSDFEIRPEARGTDEPVRRCCVEFGALEPDQAMVLDELIRNHTDSAA